MADTRGWKPIETAPDGVWLEVSMRDVERQPPEWRAKKKRFDRTVRLRRWPYGQRITKASFWIADDGFICAPTHYLPLPAPPEDTGHDKA